MTYGFTFEEMKKIGHPTAKSTNWGHELVISNRAEYGLVQFYVKKGCSQLLHFYLKRQGTLYIQEGKLRLKVITKDGEKHAKDLVPGNIFEITPGMVHGLTGLTDCTAYFFSNSFEQEDVYYISVDHEEFPVTNKLTPGNTSDFRKKYWGSIETIISKEYCGKKIIMDKHTQNSLEVHCHKQETYFVHSGEVNIGIRIGRSENKLITLKKGDVFNIFPGLMHMKIAPVNCVIIEISTKDDDSDSHLVEDGEVYIHKEY